jgi:hypothetical protein
MLTIHTPLKMKSAFIASPPLRRERQACVHMSTERVALIPQEPSRLPSPEDPGGRGSLLRVLSGRSVQLLPPPCPAADHHLAHRTFERACQAAGAAATLHPPWHTAACRMAAHPSIARKVTRMAALSASLAAASRARLRAAQLLRSSLFERRNTMSSDVPGGSSGK